MTVKEKAERYDALQLEIKFYYEEFSRRMSEAKQASELYSSVGPLMLGKTYAYSEMLEVLQGWAASSEEEEACDG